MAIERGDAALAGLMMAPLDRSVIFVAKLASNLALMACVTTVVTGAGVLFFSFDLSAAPGPFVLVISAGMLGFGQRLATGLPPSEPRIRLAA